VEQPREFPLELLVGLREEMGERRATVGHISADVAGLREEVRAETRRLETRLFRLMLAQMATFATFGVVVAALAN
jgi:hypothetical protein